MDDEELLKKAREDYAFGSDYAIRDLFDRFEQMLDDKEPKSIVWKPKKGEWYYFAGSDGTVQVTDWRGDQLDMDLLKHHNIFRTKAQAEKAAPHQSRYNMVLQAVLELEPNQVVDWSDANQKKHQVLFNPQFGYWDKSWTFCFDQGYPVLIDEKNVQPLLDYLNANGGE
jgi:hypothetical protein